MKFANPPKIAAGSVVLSASDGAQRPKVDYKAFSWRTHLGDASLADGGSMKVTSRGTYEADDGVKAYIYLGYEPSKPDLPCVLIQVTGGYLVTSDLDFEVEQ